MIDNRSRHSTNYDSENNEFSINEFLISISTLIEEIVDEQDEKIDEHKTLFYSKVIPTISIQSYLDRVIKYTKLETSTLIIMLIYIDRVCEFNKLLITKYNVHRLILSAMIVSIKVNEDDIYTNSFYAKVGGVSLQEVNKLEEEFLKLIKFRLWTDFSVYYKYKHHLVNYDKL